MKSNERHTKKPSSALSVAIAVAALLASGAAQAESKRTFVLTAYSNGPGGEKLLDGEYDAALSAIDRKSFRLRDSTASMISTNLCVAYSMKLQLDEARKACDAAVDQAKLEKIVGGGRTSGWARKTSAQYKEYIALAYSNRAVLNWLAEDASAAADDLARAQALSPQADFVARNLQALHTPGRQLARLNLSAR